MSIMDRAASASGHPKNGRHVVACDRADLVGLEGLVLGCSRRVMHSSIVLPETVGSTWDVAPKPGNRCDIETGLQLPQVFSYSRMNNRGEQENLGFMRREALVLTLMITTILRRIGANSEFWFDEIATVLKYVRPPLRTLLST